MAHMKTQILITLVVFFQAHQAWSEHCKKPDATKFPNYTIEEYVVGHILQYKCTDGYKRKAGSLSIVECKEGNKETFWNISPMQCFRYCGPPKQFQFMNFISTKFPVGQELHYQCQEGYQNKNGTSCLSTCKYENNAAVWKSQPECISTIQPVVSSTSKAKPLHVSGTVDYMIVGVTAGMLGVLVVVIPIAIVIIKRNASKRKMERHCNSGNRVKETMKALMPAQQDVESANEAQSKLPRNGKATCH
ncbi:uncharacterized protein LOC106704263 [Latimeria chalumnae]|uniref:uncharacterized protein LOC106704263 n=1 Tax=Latimeria chalumnae TaxID=7897 RepID=UPI00313D7F96